MKFKTLFNRLDVDIRDKAFSFEKPSRTLQEPKEDCDINHIVQLYCGITPAMNPLLQEPMFASEDTASLPKDLLEAYETIDDINQRFMTIPSAIRRELGDSPVNMLKWISDPANRKRGEEIGLFNKTVADSQPAVGTGMVNAEHLSVTPPPANNNTVTE